MIYFRRAGFIERAFVYFRIQHDVRDTYASPSSAVTVTFMDQSDPSVDIQPRGTSARLVANPPLKSVPLPAPAPNFNLPVDDDTDTSHDNSAGSSQPDPGRQFLFGRYIGQITARIERAWLRPRTPIENAFFACRVRITQDRNGIVQEIELVIRCNGTPQWQTSLVQAIESALPEVMQPTRTRTSRCRVRWSILPAMPLHIPTRRKAAPAPPSKT